jgi:hypothetical protein
MFQLMGYLTLLIIAAGIIMACRSGEVWGSRTPCKFRFYVEGITWKIDGSSTMAMFFLGRRDSPWKNILITKTV